MMITALIVDDEADSRSVLKKLLSQFCPQVQVIGEAGSVTSAYDLIQETKPQLVFLDIQMPGGSGFSLVKKFDEVPFELIFVTSYDKYAIDAIKMSALDYLVKPVEVAELLAAITRFEKYHSRQESHQMQVVNLIANMEESNVEKKIAVHNNDNVVLLSLGQITHMEGERNYTQIYTNKGDKYTSSKNLGEFEDMLESYPQFFRIGKSCMVNLNWVTNYSKREPCVITINDRHTYEISRRKKQDLLEKLKK
ncbi:MAG: response regulator transcription factor [Bacteroidetes bacterium]|nr:response regulator transcription factor [Bacteroidota bacterium]